MNEFLIKSIAKLFRSTPRFKGKFRLGMFIQKILNSKGNWKEPEFFITLKNKSTLYIDVRSNTHIIPFWTGNRDSEIIQLIINKIEPKSIVFDVGANIGYYAIPIATHLKKSGGQVHAFEPVNSNYQSLVNAVNKNSLESVVTVNKFALGNSKGSIDIIKTEKGNSGNAVLAFDDTDFEKDLEKESIEIDTLDNYMEISSIDRCDFIKIDIEGAEIFFIQGGLKFIEKFKPIIYGEFNSFFMKKFGFTIMDVWQLIEPLGYTPYVEDRNKKATFKKTVLKEGLIDVLFIPENVNEKNWVN